MDTTSPTITVMDTTPPIISVIVPCYNVENYLKQCLTSILAQTFSAIEIICINDASTDASLAIMQGFAADDVRMRIIDKPNEGYGASCNRGLDEARGTWVAIVEPDDWIEAPMYERMLDFAAGFDEKIDIIKTPYWRIWMPDTDIEHKFNCSYRRRIKPPQQPFTLAEASHLITHHPSIWSALYRREFLEEHHIRFNEYPGAGWADNPFLIETMVQAKNIVYLDEPFYCYREETPEKAAQFVRQSTLLPFDRWHDMMDLLDRLGVTDESIIRALYSRAFTYHAGIIEVVPLENEAVLSATERLFQRMDPELVLSDDELSPSSKKMFCDVLSLPYPRISGMRYTLRLIAKGFYNLRNVGLGFTWYQVKEYFAKRRSRISESVNE